MVTTMITYCRFLEGFNTADGKRGLRHRLVNDPDAFSVQRLNIALLDQPADCPADRIAGATEIPYWDFGFFKVNMIGYQAQVLPAILAAFTLVYLEKFFRKITPQVVSMIVVPFCSLLLAVIAAHFVLGPIGWKIGSAISAVVYAGITGPVKVLFAAIFGFVYAPLVITGLHHMSNAIDMQLIADFGGTMLWPMIALSNIAQGSAVLGMVFLQKNDADAQEVNIPSCISCYLGVTEPAMFGVNLKHVFPFVCGMIGSACAAVVSVITGCTANAIGVGGIPGILSMQPRSMLSFAVCMVITVIIPFVLTVAAGKSRLKISAGKSGEEKTAETNILEETIAETAAEADTSAENAAKEYTKEADAEKTDARKELKAYLTGKVIPLKEVNDGVFSEGIMGEGAAIIPEDDLLCAPADGTVSVLMENSRHACGLTLDCGMEILLHIGIDTVDMQGDGFEYLVKAGQRVHAGDALIRFDRDKIRKAGHPDVTVCIITDQADAQDVTILTGMDASVKTTTIISYE